MERAPELEAAVREFYAIFGNGSLTGHQSLLSREAHTLVIGNDPNEWWEGPERIDRAMQAQIADAHAMGLQIVPGDLRAYREGNIGWVVDRPAYCLPDGTRLPMRATAVARQEAGVWKLIQLHASFGIPNEDTFGREFTIPE